MRRKIDSGENETQSPVLLYLHIPKCGGSTITQVIYQQCRLTTGDRQKNKYWHRGVYFYPAGLFSQPSSPSNLEVAKMLSRRDLRAVVGHYSYGIHRYVARPSLYVTVLRTPTSRALSLYDELRAQNRIDMTLEKFILAPPFPGMENDQTRRIAGLQTVEREDGELMLEEAKRNLTGHFGVIGLTERMDETLCLLHRIFNWEKYHLSYPRNVTLKRSDRDAVSPDIMQLIADRNRLDFRLYRFAEQLLEKAIREQGAGFQRELKKYKESMKNLLEQTDLNSTDNMDRQKVHQIVLNMINKGKTR